MELTDSLGTSPDMSRYVLMVALTIECSWCDTVQQKDRSGFNVIRSQTKRSACL